MIKTNGSCHAGKNIAPKIFQTYTTQYTIYIRIQQIKESRHNEDNQSKT